MEHVALLLCLTLFFLCQAQGPSGCREQAVSAGGTLELLLEKPPQGWTRLHWRLMLERGEYRRILTAEKSGVTMPSKTLYSARAEFQRDSLSLQISRVTMADSGVYQVDIEDPSGSVTRQCFRVSVWEPIRQPRLEPRVLRREQCWCNLSLLCTVPGPGNLSYHWSCTGDVLGALEQQPQLHLQVLRDANPTICHCNASNPVSWSMASTDVAAACRATTSGVSWSYHRVKALLCPLVLGSLVTAVVVTHILVRQRGPPSRAPPSSSGHLVGPPTGEPAVQPPALA